MVRLWSAALSASVRRRLALLHHAAPQRGDVPGWVMVTVMTAGLVVAVFAVFKGAIIGAVQQAIDQVVSGTGG